MKNLVFTILFAFLLAASIGELVKDEKKEQQIQFVKEFESSQDPKVQQVIEHIKTDWLKQIEKEREQEQVTLDRKKLFDEHKSLFSIVIVVVICLAVGFVRRFIRP